MNELEDAERCTAKYLRRRFFDVQGFCTLLDANVIRRTALFQSRTGIRGALVEIGVWHGKSFFILAKSKCGDERVIAIDLFPTRPLVKGERQQMDNFLANCVSNEVVIPPDFIITGDSLDLNASEVLARSGKARVVHVDGAHDYDHALHDIKLAGDLLGDEGVIIIDDAFNRQWPEVTAALMDWIRERNDFVPWAATDAKLYLCRKPMIVQYMSMARKYFSAQMGRSASLFGNRFTLVDSSHIAKIIEAAKNRFLAPRKVVISKSIDLPDH